MEDDLKLTKKQRIAILKEAIRLLEANLNNCCYMCVAVERATTIVIKRYEYKDCSRSCIRFPELLKYKPKDRAETMGWFCLSEENKQKRIGILNEIIRSIEKQSDMEYVKHNKIKQFYYTVKNWICGKRK